MRELTAEEISQVGGGSISEYAGEGGALGVFFGGIATGTVFGAARGGTIGAALGASFGAGYEVGSWARDHLS